MSGWPRKGAAQTYLEERADALPILMRCANCRWRFRGRSDEGRLAFKEHLRTKHPELVGPKRKGKRIWRKAAS